MSPVLSRPIELGAGIEYVLTRYKSILHHLMAKFTPVRCPMCRYRDALGYQIYSGT
jgi:hypothetical protein